MLEKYPNFLIVGAARSGTTSIFKYIKDHPDVFMTEPKEPTFFPYANEVKPVFTMGRDVGFVTNIKDYLKLYEKSNGKRYLGEASTPYLYLFEKTISNIKKFVPDYRKVKIIIVLRNPIDRAYSQYMVKVRDLTEPLSFEEAIKDEKRRMQANAHFDFFYLDRGMYYNQVKSYLETFNNVKILFFEDLINNSEKVISNILDFLEVPMLENVNTKIKYNISGKPKIKFLRNLMLNPFFLKNAMKIIIPKGIKNITQEKINKYNFKKIPMKQKTRLDLVDFYKEDIKKLEEMLDVNLKHWYSI